MPYKIALLVLKTKLEKLRKELQETEANFLKYDQIVEIERKKKLNLIDAIISLDRAIHTLEGIPIVPPEKKI